MTSRGCDWRCPWCGEERETNFDYWDGGYGDGEEIEIECDCGRTYTVRMSLIALFDAESPELAGCEGLDGCECWHIDGYCDFWRTRRKYPDATAMRGCPQGYDEEDEGGD